MDTQIVDIATKVIGNLGFPIFVAIYLMVNTNKQMQAIQGALNDLANAIQQLTSFIMGKEKQ